MLDFENIMKDRGYWQEDRWMKTPKHTYTFEGGSKIEFISVDDYGKAHGPRRDVLFVNEANNLTYNIVDQLITRTREIVWLDWNPSEEFWFYTEMLPNRDDIDFITLTYKDNEALDSVTVAEIESHKYNKNWWTVYGLGQLGAIETRIYKDWRIISEVPHEARLVRYGLDFGYTNDPAAIVAVYSYNGGYIIDELLYKKGQKNEQLAAIFQTNEEALVVADSAEPKSIDDIKDKGVTIVGARKVADGPLKSYLKWSIGIVQAQKISVTSRSLDTLKEYRAYLWMTDKKTNKILNQPETGMDHAMDAIRYAIVSLVQPPKNKVVVSGPKWSGFNRR